MPSSSSPDRLSARLRRSRILNVVLAVAIAFLLIVQVAQAVDTSPDESASAEPTSTPSGNPFARGDRDDPLAIGSVDAPVVLVEWTDMRCPFCASFSRETLPAVIDEYVETGKVRIEFHDIAFFGEQSERAGAALRAAAAQGRGPEYLEAVFAAAPETGHPELPTDALLQFAEEVGVADIPAFESALADPETLASVREGTSTAQAYGVTGVPFFYAGGSALSGAQPIDVFRDFLDAALDRAE